MGRTWPVQWRIGILLRESCRSTSELVRGCYLATWRWRAATLRLLAAGPLTCRSTSRGFTNRMVSAVSADPFTSRSTGGDFTERRRMVSAVFAGWLQFHGLQLAHLLTEVLVGASRYRMVSAVSADPFTCRSTGGDFTRAGGVRGVRRRWLAFSVFP